MFHRMRMPLESVRHFDMLHPARRLWRARDAEPRSARGMEVDSGGCRLSTLERVLCDVSRVGDVPGMEIPGRYFKFLRTGDARPLEPVLEHNRLDLISLAAVSAHAVQLVEEGYARCRDAAEALALGKVYERAGAIERAIACFEYATGDGSACTDVSAEALYRLGVRLRRERRYGEAADCWRRILALRAQRGSTLLAPLRQYAVEALAIHHEHRERDYEGAKELTLQLLEESDDWTPRSVRPGSGRTDANRHRLARLEKKIARTRETLFGG